MLSKNELIDKTVDAFYQKAIDDILIGYHFVHIKDFQEHLLRIQAFWKEQLMNISYPTNLKSIELMKAHIPLFIKKGEVGRWVKLFSETINENIEETELKSEWINKIKQFEKIFLTSKLFFRH